MLFYQLVDYASSTYMNVGVIASPRTDIELAILIGGALTGTIWMMTDGEIDGLSPYFEFPANYNV